MDIHTRTYLGRTAIFVGSETYGATSAVSSLAERIEFRAVTALAGHLAQPGEKASQAAARLRISACCSQARHLHWDCRLVPSGRYPVLATIGASGRRRRMAVEISS